jgi:hypothetical protein
MKRMKAPAESQRERQLKDREIDEKRNFNPAPTPATTAVNLETRRSIPAPEGGALIRLQVGLEDASYLIENLSWGFAAEAAS